ncbi:MAG: flagellar hook-associated protein 1 [Micromonosporaceae bacterium]|nr:flagellar hook-associated protein 1 [Micromonosporaceae bacterium]
MSTFSGLSGALTSLYAQRRGIDVAGQNIANANTEGYTRQRVNLQAVGGAPPSMYTNSHGPGQGVTVTGVTRIQDAFLETRGRLEHAQSAYLSDQDSVYARVQEAFGEPSDNGLQSQLSDLSAAWHDLANQPGDSAARTQVLARATNLTDSLHDSRSAMAYLFGTTREQLDAYATDINTSAAQVAALNQSIVSANLAGAPTNELADQRDTVVMHLSQLTGATGALRDNGSIDVLLSGGGLVNGSSSRRVSAAGATRLEDVTADPVGLQWADTRSPVSVDSGQVASMLKTVNSTLPGFVGQLDQVAAALANAVNDQHTSGYDRNGDAGVPLFVTTGGSAFTAANITVGITDPDLIAAAATTAGGAGGTLNGDNADALAGLGTAVDSADTVYRQVVVSLGVAAQAADRRVGIQSSLTDDVDAARQAQSGVNLDEEMTNLMSFQRAYQAASRVINTIDSCLDTLINHTGS